MRFVLVCPPASCGTCHDEMKNKNKIKNKKLFSKSGLDNFASFIADWHQLALIDDRETRPFPIFPWVNCRSMCCLDFCLVYRNRKRLEIIRSNRQSSVACLVKPARQNRSQKSPPPPSVEYRLVLLSRSFVFWDKQQTTSLASHGQFFYRRSLYMKMSMQRVKKKKRINKKNLCSNNKRTRQQDERKK